MSYKNDPTIKLEEFIGVSSDIRAVLCAVDNFLFNCDKFPCITFSDSHGHLTGSAQTEQQEQLLFKINWCRLQRET